MVAPEHEAGKGLSVHDWLEVLEGAKPKAGGGYMARCPAHDDKNPSLSLDVGENGGAIVHCFAGCEYAEIKAAAGLERSAPPEPPSRATRTTRTTVFKIRDAVGRHVADHVRKEKPDASKDYSWRLPDGRWRLGGTKVEELPLYGSEQVESWNEGDLVVLAEGEKARDALGRAGFRALATVTGAN